MSLRYIQKGKLYNSENYNFEIKEYFTTLDRAREFIERCEDDVSINGSNKTKLLGWLSNFDDESIRCYSNMYHTLCLWIKKGKLNHYSGGFGYKTTRRTTNWLKQVYYDEGEVIILKIITNNFSDYIEHIDVDMSYEMDMQIVDEHKEVGEELEGEEHEERN